MKELKKYKSDIDYPRFTNPFMITHLAGLIGLEDAIKKCKKQLAICKKYAGDGHPDVGITYMKFGEMYDQFKYFDKSLDYYLRALEIFEKNLGYEYDVTVSTCIQLGLVYYHKGNKDKLIDYFMKSLGYKEEGYLAYLLLSPLEAFDSSGPRISTKTLLALGDLLLENKVYKMAIQIYNIMRVRLSGRNQYKKDMLILYNRIGDCYYCLSDYNNSLDFYLKALRLTKEVSSLTPLEIANMHEYIGSCYFEKKEYNKALNYFLKTLTVYKEEYGKYEKRTRVIHSYLSKIYFQLGDVNKGTYYYYY